MKVFIMALVLYEPLPLLKHFHTHHRLFSFPGVDKKIKISQDWNGHGVAAVVWEAAIVFSTFLNTISKDIYNRNVLELGSGTGLCGIIAALNGANVTFTDKSDELNICRENVEENLKQGEHNYSVLPLDWKWFDKKLWIKHDIDFLIGADLIYIEELFPYLADVFKFFAMHNKNLAIYLAGKIRYKKRYNKFIDIIVRDFRVESVNFPTPDDVYILKLTLLNR